MYVTGKSSPAYEADFYGWTQQQAKFLQEEKWSCLDIPNLVEEIESLGRQERRELKNRLGVLLGHLLKWEFQPESRSRSWLATIREQRSQVLQLMKTLLANSEKTYVRLVSPEIKRPTDIPFYHVIHGRDNPGYGFPIF